MSAFFGRSPSVSRTCPRSMLSMLSSPHSIGLRGRRRDDRAPAGLESGDGRIVGTGIGADPAPQRLFASALEGRSPDGSARYNRRYFQNGLVSSSFRHSPFAPVQPKSARAWLAPTTHPTARCVAGSLAQRTSLRTNIALTVAASLSS